MESNIFMIIQAALECRREMQFMYVCTSES